MPGAQPPQTKQEHGPDDPEEVKASWPARVDSTDLAIASNPYPGALSHLARAAPDLEHTLARAKASQLEGLLAHGRSSTKRHDLAEQAVEVRPAEDMTSRHRIAAVLRHHVLCDVAGASMLRGRT